MASVQFPKMCFIIKRKKSVLLYKLYIGFCFFEIFRNAIVYCIPAFVYINSKYMILHYFLKHVFCCCIDI